MENSIVHQSSGREWKQVLDLLTGTWTQSHLANDVLIWQDTWDMSETLYDPYRSNPTATLLAAKYASAVDEADEGYARYWVASSLIAASVIGVSLYTCF